MFNGKSVFAESYRWGRECQELNKKPSRASPIVGYLLVSSMHAEPKG
ncbi:hypothetical protein CMS1076 [Clavibacter sepedonicus]|uniref:Uncharacterized protein n=1 Tax=Clavibacter sepedonicus TaxID=31964 RepID=B0RGD4_CLASE|nr:hypothetical protein CMS1076 [Clavibacter sepedonicus]